MTASLWTLSDQNNFFASCKSLTHIETHRNKKLLKSLSVNKIIYNCTFYLCRCKKNTKIFFYFEWVREKGWQIFPVEVKNREHSKCDKIIIITIFCRRRRGGKSFIVKDYRYFFSVVRSFITELFLFMQEGRKRVSGNDKQKVWSTSSMMTIVLWKFISTCAHNHKLANYKKKII